jgi:hypothetical protein
MQILVMIGIAILGWFLSKAGGVSILLILLAIIQGLLASDKVKENSWAKALSGLLMPALIAVAIVTVLAFLFNILAPESGDVLINWEEWCTIHLYRILKWISPPWWLYLTLLAAAAWADTRQTRWKMTSSLTSGKKKLGETLAVISLLAGVTFFSQATVIRPAYLTVRHELFLRYNQARKDKNASIEKFVAERVVAQGLRRSTPDEQATLRTCFLQISRIGYSNNYDNHLVEFYASKELKSLPLGLPSAPPELALMRVEPTYEGEPDPFALAVAIPAEEAASSKAAVLEASARPGLEKIAKLLFGQGSDKVVSIAFSYIDHLVDAYGAHYASVMPGALNDLVEPVTQAYVSQYVDKVVDLASSKIEWKGLPTGAPDAVAAAVSSDQQQLAETYLAHAELRSKEILQEVQTSQDPGQLTALSNEAAVLGDEVQQAGAILKAHPSIVGTAIAASQQAAFTAAALSSRDAARAAKAAYEAANGKSLKINDSQEAVRSIEEGLSHVHE